MLSLDLAVAIGLFISVLLPVSVSYLVEQKRARACYHRALAIGIVDGEMEILAAGEWRAFAQGEQDYPIKDAATLGLPAGKFKLVRTANKLRLEWQPVDQTRIAPVVREATGQ